MHTPSTRILSALAYDRQRAQLGSPAGGGRTMTLGAVTGDIVLADREGRRFYAIVTERRDRELAVEPIDRRVTYYTVKAREVLGIWRKSRARTAGGRPGEAGGVSTAYAANGNRPADQSLVVVRVEDAIDPRLAGRAGVVYESPPQPRAQAIALVPMLVGNCGEPVGNEAGRWVAAVAGGRRIVTLSPVACR